MKLIPSKVQMSERFGANSKITESIIEAGCEIQSAAPSRSLIGRQAKVRGRGDGHFIQLNVGDNSHVAFMEPNGQ